MLNTTANNKRCTLQIKISLKQKQKKTTLSNLLKLPTYRHLLKKNRVVKNYNQPRIFF